MELNSLFIERTMEQKMELTKFFMDKSVVMFMLALITPFVFMYAYLFIKGDSDQTRREAFKAYLIIFSLTVFPFLLYFYFYLPEEWKSLVYSRGIPAVLVSLIVSGFIRISKGTTLTEWKQVELQQQILDELKKQNKNNGG